jgi:lipoate-protein ligase A
VDVVRRPTGGRAVFHAEEVTYSVVIPRTSDFFSKQIQTVYNQIGHGLVCSLRLLGVKAELQKGTVDLKNHYDQRESVACFSVTSRYEVMVNNKKIIGSAQRHISGNILQHGSILTGSAHSRLPDFLNHISPDAKQKMRTMLENRTSNICQCLGDDVSYEDISLALKRGMSEVLSIQFEPACLSEEEKQLVDKMKPRLTVTNLNETVCY